MRHPFEHVDSQDDPVSWVGVLDKVRAEPAYAAYKARLVEMLGPKTGRRYLEVGVGSGSDALALIENSHVSVIGVDSSETMAQEARRRGLGEVVVADAQALPFEDESFDGAWSDRTFQHLLDPAAALRELVRVTRHEGRVVVADPDYSTQVVNVVDQEIAKKVLAFRTEHGLRNGSLGHQMGRLFVEAGLREVEVAAMPVAIQDPKALDNALGLRTWASAAHERGLLAAHEVRRWEAEIDTAVSEGYFLYGFNVFITAGSK